MLKQSRPTRTRRIAGLALVALLGLGGAYAAWAAQAPRPTTSSDANATGAEWAVHLDIANGASAMSASSDMQLIVREGEPTEVRYGRDDDRRTVIMTVVGLGDGIADLKVQLYRRDKLESAPELHVKVGEPAQIKVGSDNGTASAFEGFDLRVTVKRADSKLRAAVTEKTIGDHNPTYGRMSAPEYPAAAVKNRVQGIVFVKAAVAADGSVTEAHVDHVKPEAASVLGDAAVKAVKAWRFNPAVFAGHPVAGAALVPIRFSLQPPADVEQVTAEAGALEMVTVQGEIQH